MQTQSQPALQIRTKHPLAIRWMHWINFPLLFTMIWSGILIYWADSIPDQGHFNRVYRVGLGSHTLFRLFPDWFYSALNAPYRLTTGLGYHFFFMWLFALNGIAYVVYLTFSGAWKDLLPARHTLRDAWHVFLYDLRLRKEVPPHRTYNAAQRIAYTIVVLMGAASCLTGIAIWKPTSLHWITTLLGGYETARWLHFWLTMGFIAFFLIHISQVALAGWNNFRSMVSGDELISDQSPLPTQPEEPLA